MNTTLSPWPGNREGAVSLSFDDGMASQLALAVPMLNDHNLQATFYVNPRDGWEETLAPWRVAADAGHEMGNHTVSHPCSHNFAFIADNGRRSLEEMTLEEMEAEILEAGRRLDVAFPDQGAVSFGYPCYQPFVGQGLSRKSYVPLVAQHCQAGRGRGERPNDPLRCDLAYLWSTPCERMSGAEMVGLAEQAAVQGRWSVLTFHGVSEGGLSIAVEDLRELCAFLARQRDRIWTAPVATIARHLSVWRQQ
ncbi:MAG: polysaccharide deacetylase family protein [Caldilineaceae bacterium]|nr:polysaccharide deacetylase family protein [Caldilineaceae bacterium]